jgi:G:T-mismatch repair DNA endonuclease (very short patch repair protein)
LKERPIFINQDELKIDRDKNKILIDNKFERYYKYDSTKLVVDGIKDKIVYEFNGCKFHGCRKCFPQDVHLYNRTMEKQNILEATGYEVVTMWECDWNKKKKMLGKIQKK